jgi:hypothetical protein
VQKPTQKLKPSSVFRSKCERSVIFSSFSDMNLLIWQRFAAPQKRAYGPNRGCRFLRFGCGCCAWVAMNQQKLVCPSHACDYVVMPFYLCCGSLFRCYARMFRYFLFFLRFKFALLLFFICCIFSTWGYFLCFHYYYLFLSLFFLFFLFL